MLKCPRIQRILLKDVNGSAAGSSNVVRDVINGGVVLRAVRSLPISENGHCGDVPNIDSTTPAELCSVDLVNVSLHFQQNWNAILSKLIDILDMQERPVCVDEDRRQCTAVSGVVKSFAKSFSGMNVSHWFQILETPTEEARASQTWSVSSQQKPHLLVEEGRWRRPDSAVLNCTASLISWSHW